MNIPHNSHYDIIFLCLLKIFADIIFLIYLYQRWIYPVDKKRVNEFGQVADPDAVTDDELLERRDQLVKPTQPQNKNESEDAQTEDVQKKNEIGATTSNSNLSPKDEAVEGNQMKERNKKKKKNEKEKDVKSLDSKKEQ